MLTKLDLNIPFAEKRTALLKSSEHGHVEVTANLVEDGMNSHHQPTTSSTIRLVHFDIVNHRINSVVADARYLATED